MILDGDSEAEFDNGFLVAGDAHSSASSRQSNAVSSVSSGPRKLPFGLRSRVGRWLATGVAFLLVLSFIAYFFPDFLPLLRVVAIVGGLGLVFRGGVKCLVVAFREGVKFGLMWLFVPFFRVDDICTRWVSVKCYTARDAKSRIFTL